MSKSRLAQSAPSTVPSKPIDIQKKSSPSPSSSWASSWTPGSVAKPAAPIQNHQTTQSHQTLFDGPPASPRDDGEYQSPWTDKLSGSPQEEGIFELEEDESDNTKRQEGKEPQQERYATKSWF